MNVFEALRTGLIEIYSHKTRSFLSFIAIAFGVAAILYTFAQVNRMYQRREKAFELVGPGRMKINRKRDFESKGLSRGLTLGDARAIRKALPDLYMVSPEVSRWGVHFKRGDFFNRELRVVGVTPDWAKRDWVYELTGRFFDEHDLKTYSRVGAVPVDVEI